MKTNIYPVSSINPKVLYSENKCFLLVTSCPDQTFELTDTEYSFILVIDATIKLPDKFQKLYTSITKQKFSDQTYCLLKKVSQIILQVATYRGRGILDIM